MKYKVQKSWWRETRPMKKQQRDDAQSELPGSWCEEMVTDGGW